MFRSRLIATLVLAAAAGAAQADTLWQQLPNFDNPSGIGFPNRYSTTSAIYALSDVTVPASGWTINSVSTYFTNISFPATVGSAILNIFPKTGDLPLATNDPRAAPTGQGTLLVPVDTRGIGGATQQPLMTITAANLNIVLAPGDYWIGLTPQLSTGPFGGENAWGTDNFIGSQSVARGFGSGANTFPWTGVGTLANHAPFDLSISITGTPVPAPSSLALLGLGGLIAGRRRR